VERSRREAELSARQEREREKDRERERERELDRNAVSEIFALFDIYLKFLSRKSLSVISHSVFASREPPVPPMIVA